MKGKDEVQDGWKGKIMPFDMIQKTFFGDDLNLIKIREELIEKHQSELAELIPEVEEGEEEIELTDEQKKQQKNLTEKIKTIRKEIIQITKRLEENTIKKIETLTDDEVNMLLEKKWITPLVDSLNEMPGSVVADFIDAITKLTEKYAVTLTSLNKQIETTQNELFSLMGELTGSDFDIKGLETLKNLLGGM